MRTTQDGHLEPHKTSFALSDIILGGQDGLVNVLGVILGVAAASGDQRIVIAAGLAATFAESISMGAVAYTSTLADADYYQAERDREIWEIENKPEKEKEEIRQIFAAKGFKGATLDQIVETITADKKVWLTVMMSDELRLQPVDRSKALHSALIVGFSAFAGSLVPLFPFFLFPVQIGIAVAIFIAGIVLFLVGAYKARVTVGRWYKSGIEMMIIGVVSALAGYAVGLVFKAPTVP